MPENHLAWDLYHQARLEGVGDLILSLRQLELTPFEAEELAYKLETVAVAYAELDAVELKTARDEADVRRRMLGR